jgi:hypothetical protein
MQLEKMFKSFAGYIIAIPFYAILNLFIAIESLFFFSKRKLTGKFELGRIYPVPYNPTHSDLDISVDISLGCLPDSVNEIFSYSIPKMIPASANLILLELVISSPDKNIYEEREYRFMSNNSSEDFFLFLGNLEDDTLGDKINSYRLWIRVSPDRSFQIEMKNKINGGYSAFVMAEIKIISYKSFVY